MTTDTTGKPTGAAGAVHGELFDTSQAFRLVSVDGVDGEALLKERIELEQARRRMVLAQCTFEFGHAVPVVKDPAPCRNTPA